MTWFTVEGRGEFPVDMLRHDECWPTDIESAAAICARYGLDDEIVHAKRRINLATKGRAFPSRRWTSFNWNVVECSGPFDPRARLHADTQDPVS